jgi:CDP-glucose 4,6-dehydratase
VGRAYDQPIETFETNVLGTANLLQSVLNFQSSRWAIVITTDKVYENLELADGYSERDPLGGKDPYSASKAAAEMVVSAWRTIASHKKSDFVVSTARAGNVIGGGDHAANRLVPDLIRSFRTSTKAVIRNPASLRPWQHVLDPLRGYLLMGSKLLRSEKISPSYNFGPSESSKLTVMDVANAAASLWPGNKGIEIQIDTLAFHESKLLWLCSDLAEKELGWRNHFDAIESIRMTVEWERLSATSAVSALDVQISQYFWEKL